MAAADGTIVIDTKIDTSGLNKGSSQIESACKKAASSVDSLGRNMKEELAKTPTAANDAAQNVQKAASLMKNAYTELPDKARTVIESINQIGKSAKGSISEVPAAASNAATQLQSLADSSKTAFSSLPSSAASAAVKVTEIGHSAASARGKLAKMGGVAKKAARFLKDLGKSAKRASSSTKGLGGSLKTLLRYGLGIKSLFMLARKLREALTEGLSNLSSYSSQTNASIANLKASLSTLKNSLATAFAPVLNVVVPILTKLINLLATAASYISMFFAVLSGKSTYTKAVAVQADYAAALEDTATGASDAAKSTEEAAEAAQDYLSPLDEINRYTTDKVADSGGSGGGGGAGARSEASQPLFEEAEIAPGMTEFVDRLKGIFEKLFTPFRQAWEAEGAATIDAAKYALSSLQALAAAVGRSLMAVWTNGTGAQTLTLILQIIQNILNLVGNLATRFTEAWTANDIGTQIIQNIWNLLNIVLNTIERIIGATAAWALALDFTPLLTSINDLLLALQPLTANIGAGLEWFWVNVLLPIAGWTIQDAVPAFLGLLSGAIDVLNAVIEVFKPLGIWLWNNFLEPVAQWAGKTVVDLITAFADALKNIGDYISEHEGAFRALVTIAASFAAAWALVNGALLIWNGLVTAWSAIGTIAAAVTSAFGAAVAFLTSPITIVIAIIGVLIAAIALLVQNWDEVSAWLKETWTKVRDFLVETGESIKNGIINAIDALKSWLSNAWSSIKEKALSIATNIRDSVSSAWQNLKDKTISAFASLKEKVSDTFTKLKEAIKKPINGIIGFINKLISGVVKGINSMIGALNKLSFDVPDWVPVLGGKKFGFNIKTLTAPQIPYLASGAVIPPRSEFLAVLGDQQRGTNIETPEALLRQIMREELAGLRGGKGGSYQFTAQINRRTIFDEIVEEAKLRQIATGRNPFELA